MQVSHWSVGWNGLLKAVQKATQTWKPPQYSREIQYRDSLRKFLKEHAPEATIVSEYRHNGTTADLCVLWPSATRIKKEPYRLLIEIKRDLKRKSEYDRLVGQIASLDPDKHKVLVVLCGDTSEELLGKLRNQHRSFLEDTWNDQFGIVIIQPRPKT